MILKISPTVQIAKEGNHLTSTTVSRIDQQRINMLRYFIDLWNLGWRVNDFNTTAFWIFFAIAKHANEFNEQTSKIILTQYDFHCKSFSYQKWHHHSIYNIIFNFTRSTRDNSNEGKIRKWRDDWKVENRLEYTI